MQAYVVRLYALHLHADYIWLFAVALLARNFCTVPLNRRAFNNFAGRSEKEKRCWWMAVKAGTQSERVVWFMTRVWYISYSFRCRLRTNEQPLCANRAFPPTPPLSRLISSPGPNGFFLSLSACRWVYIRIANKLPLCALCVSSRIYKI